MNEISPPPHARQQPQARFTFSDRSLSRISSPRSPSWTEHGVTTNSRSDSRTRLRSTETSFSPLRRRQSSIARKSTEDSLSSQDIRTRLPVCLQRFSGYRDPTLQPPYDPLPFPPFSWLNHLPLKYETWLLSTIGSFISIALIEVVLSAAFPDHNTILIVASFGASAVLCFATTESPLAQPRHLLGGQILSAVLGVGINRLFRLSPNYHLHDVIWPGDLNQLVWVSGALSMSLSLLLMQLTGTTHPPGGATALIAAVQPAAVEMSWRLVYVVVISSLLMLVWALIINNVGRRRYPSYWLSGKELIVRDRRGDFIGESLDEAEMKAEEGRSRAFELGILREEQDTETNPLDNENRGSPMQQLSKEMSRGRRFERQY